MIEFVTTAIITLASLMLFGYWYRYTCLLILSAKTTRNYAFEVAEANQLSFLAVQNELQAKSESLDLLHQSLDRDYRFLAELVRNATGRSEYQMEDRMLQLDYLVMATVYKTTRRFSSEMARKALGEMSMVVEHFANAMGERGLAVNPA